MSITFQAWPKIPRLGAEKVIVTEKIDGTNACVVVLSNETTSELEVAAQSRTRIITPDADNYGFALWVKQNRDELVKLGPGYHYGEWWGCGINRGYDLHERRFSLFNVWKWGDRHRGEPGLNGKGEWAPACCHVVPVLGVHQLNHVFVSDTENWGADYVPSFFETTRDTLSFLGSAAARGFMKPEGIVLWFAAIAKAYKWTFEKQAGKHDREAP